MGKSAVNIIGRSAIFSDDRRHRYVLTRRLADDAGDITFVMLNPSTADEVREDPTIRRVLGFARRWHYGTVHILNIFALRSTDPKRLYQHPDPIGPNNDRFLKLFTGRDVDKVILAWGSHGELHRRGDAVIKMLRDHRGTDHLFALGMTKTLQPAHPLYLRGDLDPLPIHKLWNRVDHPKR